MVRSQFRDATEQLHRILAPNTRAATGMLRLPQFDEGLALPGAGPLDLEHRELPLTQIATGTTVTVVAHGMFIRWMSLRVRMTSAIRTGFVLLVEGAP